MKRISDHQAVLIRDLRVRAINISGSGCLIESRRRLDVGTVGTLRLTLGTEECVDDVEVVRCEAAGDVGTVYHVGVRFLWTKPREAGIDPPCGCTPGRGPEPNRYNPRDVAGAAVG